MRRLSAGVHPRSTLATVLLEAVCDSAWPVGVAGDADGAHRRNDMTVGNGLSTRRSRTCPCGVVFTAKTPQATYCSVACRKASTRFGRTYGTVVPRVYGEART